MINVLLVPSAFYMMNHLRLLLSSSNFHFQPIFLHSMVHKSCQGQFRFSFRNVLQSSTFLCVFYCPCLPMRDFFSVLKVLKCLKNPRVTLIKHLRF